MTDLNDISLVAQVAVFHNKRAFDQLVRKYQSPVRRFLLSLTAGNESLSDDLAQDTFIKAYTGIAGFRGMASFQTWLTRIAYNVFYDYRRRQHDDLSLAAGGDAPTAYASTSAYGLRSDIYAALRQLKDEERVCITMQLIEGYAIDEIAQTTGMPQNTVKSHLRRGKEKLTNYLKQNGYDGK